MLKTEPKYTIQMDVDSSVEQVAELIRSHLQSYIDARITGEGQSFPLPNNARVFHKLTYEDLLSFGNWDLQGIGKEVIFAISADIVGQLLGRFE